MVGNKSQLLASLVTTSLLISVSTGSVIYVDVNSTNEIRDGSSWCSAYQDLQDALQLAIEGDEIKVAQGMYKPDSGSSDREASFHLVSGVKIFGSFAGCGAVDPDLQNHGDTPTILSGDLSNNDGIDFLNFEENSYHVVSAINVNSDTLLNGVTITGGYADGPNFGPSPDSKDQGSGINNYWSTARYENCTLRNNFSFNHGAFNDHGGAIVINCFFTQNKSVGWGGALFNAPGISTTVTGCQFINNQTDGNKGGGGGMVIGGDSMITDCLFQENYSNTHGGGVYIHNQSRPTLLRCDFINNSTELLTRRGGGLYNIKSHPTLEECLFLDNKSSRGAAIWSGSDDSSLTITKSRFYSNIATIAAGGIYNSSSKTSINGSTFWNNYSSEYGGGIWNLAGRLTLNKCLFVGNTCDEYGGGILQEGGSISVNHCIFSGNTAMYGGGIHFSSGDIQIFNSTISHNHAYDMGGGVSKFSGSMVNCILWNNQDITGMGESSQITLVSNDPTFSIDYSCIKGWSGILGGEGNFGDDPLFEDPDGVDDLIGTIDDNTNLLPGSSCIDAGNNNFACPSSDYFGNPRRINDIETLDSGLGLNPIMDIGAVEYIPWDCNDNGIQDNIDITEKYSSDNNNNGVPDECEVDTEIVGVPLPDPSSLNKNRYLSIVPGNSGKSFALRVTLSSLDQFTSYNNESRWVGAPQTYHESDLDSKIFVASQLQCSPYVHDWGTIELLNVYGAEVVPASLYHVQSIPENCLELIVDETVYSSPLSSRTAKWGDVVAPFDGEGATQPTIADVLSLVDKWLGNLEPLKTRSQLQPNIPNPSLRVSIADILKGVDAWLGTPYPFAGPTACP